MEKGRIEFLENNDFPHGYLRNAMKAYERSGNKKAFIEALELIIRILKTSSKKKASKALPVA